MFEREFSVGDFADADFKVGSRIAIEQFGTGEEDDYSRGTVVEVVGDSYRIKWDDGFEDSDLWDASSLIPEELV